MKKMLIMFLVVCQLCVTGLAMAGDQFALTDVDEARVKVTDQLVITRAELDAAREDVRFERNKKNEFLKFTLFVVGAFILNDLHRGGGDTGLKYDRPDKRCR